jgi:hypothetical protein
MRVRVADRNFTVLTEADVLEKGIPVAENWRSAQPGEWVRTDDGKIIKVLRRTQAPYVHKLEPKKPKEQIHTGYGRFSTSAPIFDSKDGRLYDRNRDRGLPYVRDTRCTAMQKIFLDKLITFGTIDDYGLWTEESVLAAYQNTYRENNDHIALKRGLRMLQKRSAKKHMSEKMITILDDVGLTDQYIGDKLKNWLEQTGKKAPPWSVKRALLQEIIKLRGHKADVQEPDVPEDLRIGPAEIKVLQAIKSGLSAEYLKDLANDVSDAEAVKMAGEIIEKMRGGPPETVPAEVVPPEIKGAPSDEEPTQTF